jgi:hypothetical protein
MKACVVYSQGAYTQSYAEDFVKRWEHLFGSRLETLDLSQLLKTTGFQLSIAESKGNALFIDGQKKKIILAFHPTFGFSANPDEYLDHSLGAAYTNTLLSGLCPNPPFVGQWGLHFSWIVGRRILSGLGFPLATVNSPDSSSTGLARVKTHAVFNSRNVQECKVPEIDLAHSLVMPDLPYKDWPQRLRIIHSIGFDAYLYDAKGQYQADLSQAFDFAGLQKTLGTRVLELVAIESSDQLAFLGFNPSLTLFPDQSLNALKLYTDGTT